MPAGTLILGDFGATVSAPGHDQRGGIFVALLFFFDEFPMASRVPCTLKTTRRPLTRVTLPARQTPVKHGGRWDVAVKAQLGVISCPK